MKKRISRRDFLRMAGGMAAGAALAGCAPKTVVVETEKVVTQVVKETVVVAGTPEVVEKEVTRVVTAVPQAQEITLLIDGGGGTPNDEEGRVGLGPAAEDYMDLNPNVTIEWYTLPPGSDRLEWLHARMTAKDCPDVYWYNADSLWPHIHKGWALDMTEAVNMPNPYMPGQRPWQDYIDEVGRTSQIGPDGKIYGINLDGAGVLIIYNKDALAEVGFEEKPVTWTEYVEVWERLLEADYIPFGGDMSQQCCYAHWTHGHVFNQLAYDIILDYDETGDQFVTAKEMVQHTQRGDWPLWEYFTGMAHFFKEQAPFLPKGYQAELDYRQLFRQAKVAMYMEGNWTVGSFNKDPPPFEYDWMFYPIITKDLWPESTEKTVRLQGPWGGMQYHIPGYLGETDPSRIPAIIDFLMFISQADYVSASCAERGVIPMVEGATTIPEMEPFLAPYDRAVAYQSWAMLSPTAYERERGLLAEYMSTDMSDDQLVAEGQVIWDDEVRKTLENNPEWVL